MDDLEDKSFAEFESTVQRPTYDELSRVRFERELDQNEFLMRDRAVTRHSLPHDFTKSSLNEIRPDFN